MKRNYDERRCNKVWKTAGRQRMTLNDIAADRQEWRNLKAASMAEISWTMIT